MAAFGHSTLDMNKCNRRVQNLQCQKTTGFMSHTDTALKVQYTHTHTHTQPFNGPLSGTTRVGRHQKKHSPAHTHPDHQTSFIKLLQNSSIYNDPQHPPCSVYVLDSPFWQPLSRSSLVFLLVLDPLLHTPYISSPNHHFPFTTHAHTIAARSVMLMKLDAIQMAQQPTQQAYSTPVQQHINRMQLLVTNRLNKPFNRPLSSQNPVISFLI